MIRYLVRRLVLAVPLLALISLVSFVVIELPPGDYLDQKIMELEQINGDASSLARAEKLRHRYGLDRPFSYRYGKWVRGVAVGDFGESFRYEREVSELIWGRLGYTVLLSMGSLFFVYALAVPLGIWSATRQYRWSDHLVSLVAFAGMSVPGFLVALVLLVVVFRGLGVPLFGLYSPYYQGAPMSLGKLGDLLQHLWLPVAVIGVNGTGGLIRIMRANMLDVLGEPFVRTARAKGLSERTVLVKHAARIAVNPLISILGMSLPDILSGTMVVSVVLGLPTVGPMLLQALLDQDMFLAGTLIFFMSVLLVIGNLLADLALALADPRIRHA